MNRFMAMTLAATVAATATMALPTVAYAQDDAASAGDRYYDRALRYVRTKKYDKAVEFFEKALPYQNDSSDIFYNLVNTAEAIKDNQRVYLYALGFLYLEPDTDDARNIKRKQAAALKALKKRKKVPVEVTFDIEPAGIELTINDVVLGRAQRAPVLLLPGDYRVKGSKLDFHDLDKAFEVVSGAPQRVAGALEKMIFHGLLAVKTNPESGVEVYVDDRFVGKSPVGPERLETRRYLVRFEKEGYDRWIRYVTIEKDKTVLLEPTMERTTGTE